MCLAYEFDSFVKPFQGFRYSWNSFPRVYLVDKPWAVVFNAFGVRRNRNAVLHQSPGFGGANPGIIFKQKEFKP
jgi:hypothetical protein